MTIFVESIDKGIWDVIEYDPFVPMLEKDKVFSEKPWSQWTEHESKNVQYDCIEKKLASEDKWCPLASFFVMIKCSFIEITLLIEKVVGGISIKGAWDPGEGTMFLNTKIETDLISLVLSLYWSSECNQQVEPLCPTEPSAKLSREEKSEMKSTI